MIYSPSKPRVVLYFICTVLQCDLPPLRPRLEIESGTGKLEARTLTTRPPHLLNPFVTRKKVLRIS